MSIYPRCKCSYTRLSFSFFSRVSCFRHSSFLQPQLSEQCESIVVFFQNVPGTSIHFKSDCCQMLDGKEAFGWNSMSCTLIRCPQTMPSVPPTPPSSRRWWISTALLRACSPICSGIPTSPPLCFPVAEARCCLPVLGQGWMC